MTYCSTVFFGMRQACIAVAELLHRGVMSLPEAEESRTEGKTLLDEIWRQMGSKPGLRDTTNLVLGATDTRSL